VKNVIKTGVILALSVSLLACASKKGGHSGDMHGFGDNVQFYGTDLSPQQEKDLLAKRSYYFGYDRFEVNEDDTLSIYAHAKRLITTPRAKVRVEGHTDNRGSREYNIALGERRANAVANILLLKGAGQDQISVVSYGKEKPAVSGDNESAWSQNRRTVIVYEMD
jgi:peptidoglycan-associated lipoprotein